MIRVQIDQFWTFVNDRKEAKRWIWYAYNRETKQLLDFHIGKSKSCKLLLKKLSHLQIETYCTDIWKCYQKYVR